MIKKIIQKSYQYALLMRWHRPIGILLLMWPTLWALWIASDGRPSPKLVIIFVLGVVVMRSAGCVINDFADRGFDGEVQRTRQRPLVTGQVSAKEAIGLFLVLSLLAFFLVLCLNYAVLLLAIPAILLVVLYPFSKRYTYLPQLILGMVYNGVPMAFAAELGTVPPLGWFLFFIALLWTFVFDTFYAMADRPDDLRIGVKSTAVLFGSWDIKILVMLQALLLLLLIGLGIWLKLSQIYYIALLIAAGLMGYQQYLIQGRDRDRCFKAFLNNHWFGFVLFMGFALSYV